MELVLEESIIYVHPDLMPFASLSVGFNDDKQLVIVFTYDRDEEYLNGPIISWEKEIIIDRKGIELLLDVLHTNLMKLPQKISKKFGVEGESWSTSEVFDTFNGILSFLERQNIPYHIQKINH